MIISTKYKIGEEVYVIYKVDDWVRVSKDKIRVILIKNEDEVKYLLENSADEFNQDELINVEYDYDLKDKVVELIEQNTLKES